MPSVTHDGQSFSIDGRRIWLVGASIQYARVPAELWVERIAAAKQAGFNLIQTACPWLLHEPRKDRFVFDGQANIKKFVELCGQAGMRVMLRPGPYVGAGFDGGGLPSWLTDIPDLVPRQASEPFLERVALYFRRLFAELADLYATGGGPIVLVQSEHAWLCSNPEQAEDYLREITRMIRESGVAVPITNANDLWQESVGTIDTWRGWNDLLANLRQLRSVQPDAPRLVSTLQVAGRGTWGGEIEPRRDGAEVLQRMAQVLAAGAQPIVGPFHGGTNFEFLGGRLAGGPDRFVTASAAARAPLGEAGARGEAYRAIKRIASFASHFGHVFAELQPDYQPITLDLAHDGAAGHCGLSVVALRGPAGRIVFVFDRAATRENHTPRGSADASVGETRATLLLEDGVRMPIDLGEQAVGWYVLDVDLSGSGRLDYCNLCPYAIVDRSILVLHGPEKARAYLSINGSPLEAVVPAGHKPTVILHKNVTVVICNREQIDATYHTDSTVYVGASALTSAGEPLSAPGFAKAWQIVKGGQVRGIDLTSAHAKSAAGGSGKGRGTPARVEKRGSPVPPQENPGSAPQPQNPAPAPSNPPAPPAAHAKSAPASIAQDAADAGAMAHAPVAPAAAIESKPKRKPRPKASEPEAHVSIALRDWRACSAAPHADGTSPRFATLDGPQPLTACGAPEGYGWYRIVLESATARSRLLHWPDCGDRVHLYHHGKLSRIIGYGPAAQRGPFQLKLGAKTQTLVALADNFGRPSEGNDIQTRRGVYGEIIEVRPLKTPKPKVREAAQVDPFTLRGFIAGGTQGQLSSATQLVWTFTLASRNAILLDVDGVETSGTFMLNDKPLAYHAGLSGSCVTRVMLDHGKTGLLKKGKNELRFAPDAHIEADLAGASAGTSLLECIAPLTEGASWAFAKWQAPEATEFIEPTRASMKAMRGRPCWWSTSFATPPQPLGNAHALWLDTGGLSKGQAYLNGRNLGRYFTAGPDGKHVGPQTRMYMPHPWLKSGRDNELLIFDEHGFDPGKCRLVISATGEMD